MSVLPHQRALNVEQGLRNRQDVCGACKPRSAPGVSSGSEASRSSRSPSCVLAAALRPSAIAASPSSSSGLRVSRDPASRSWTSALPTSSTARSSVRARGAALSGNAANRPYIRSSHSNNVGGNEATAARRRSARAKARRRRVRCVGDIGGADGTRAQRPQFRRRARGLRYRTAPCVPHLVRGREKRHEGEGHGREHGHNCLLPGSGDHKAGRQIEKADDQAKCPERVNCGQRRELDDCREQDASSRTECQCQGARVSPIGCRPEQQQNDRDHDQGETTGRPCGQDPKDLNRANRYECPCRIQESRQPIRYCRRHGVKRRAKLTPYRRPILTPRSREVAAG